MSKIKIDQNENDISIARIINLYINSSGKIILYALVPILLSAVILAFSEQFIFSKKDTTHANLLVKEELLSNVSKTFIFNVAHITDAVKKSGLSEKVKVDEKFLQSFDIISGHTDLNVLIDDYISRDFLSLTKQLYFKPEQVDDLRKDLVSQSSSFKILTFSNRDKKLSTSEISLLISNLVDVVNKSLQVEYDFSNIKLKKIELMELNNPISSMDVSKINSRLALVRNYLNILEDSYSSFAPEINLKVYMNNLNGNEDLFNFVIQENEVYKDIIISKLKLDIQALDKNINALKLSMDKFDFSNTTIGEQDISTPDASINADSSFIDTILDLGDKASSSDQRKKYLDDILTLEKSKTLVERRLEDLKLKTDFGLPIKVAEKYLINSLNETTNILNEYIDIVRNTKQNIEVFTLLSFSKPNELSFFVSIINPILLILIGSFSFSFLIVTIGLIRQNNSSTL